MANISAVPAGKARVPVVLFAVSVAVIITNVFSPQTLVGLMASSFGMPTAKSGLVPMIPLLGYAAGLFFLVPLADLVENRKLVLRMLTCASLSAAGIVFASNLSVLIFLLFTLGAASSSIQVLIPTAAAISAPEERGRVIGDIMSGLMIGILLARPVASFLAGTWGWRGFYVASAIAVAVLGLTLGARLPERHPATTNNYRSLITSLWHLFSSEPVLRRRSISAAIVMAAFNLYWTSIVYVLGAAPFNLGQRGVAVFALAGAGGAIVTPLVGRWADKGLSKRVTYIAHIVLVCGFGVAAFSGLNQAAPPFLLLTGLALGAIMLDVGVLGDQTVGRYLINLLQPQARGRINGIFVGVFFIGGAAGSALAGMLWASGGWAAICAGGAALGIMGFFVHHLSNDKFDPRHFSKEKEKTL